MFYGHVEYFEKEKNKHKWTAAAAVNSNCITRELVAVLGVRTMQVQFQVPPLVAVTLYSRWICALCTATRD